MAFTPEGMRLIWDAVSDVLKGGTVKVRGDGETASASIESIEVNAVDGGCRLTVAATFDEDTGNFSWDERAVLTADGITLDVEKKDAGRKVFGSVWRTEVDLDLTGE